MGGRDFHQAAKKVRRLPTYIKQAVNTNIESVMRAVKITARRNLFTGGNRQVVSGTLAQSITHDDLLGDVVTADIDVVDESYSAHATRVTAPHGPYVEYGTGTRQRGSPQGRQFKSPSTPPFNEILTWIQLKGIEARSEKYRDSDGGTNEIALAEAIAESIETFGNRPHPYLRPAWREHRQSFSTAHRNGVRTALRRAF